MNQKEPNSMDNQESNDKPLTPKKMLHRIWASVLSLVLAGVASSTGTTIIINNQSPPNQEPPNQSPSVSCSVENPSLPEQE